MRVFLHMAAWELGMVAVVLPLAFWLAPSFLVALLMGAGAVVIGMIIGAETL
jgi:hypothetical protein